MSCSCRRHDCYSKPTCIPACLFGNRQSSCAKTAEPEPKYRIGIISSPYASSAIFIKWRKIINTYQLRLLDTISDSSKVKKKLYDTKTTSRFFYDFLHMLKSTSSYSWSNLLTNFINETFWISLSHFIVWMQLVQFCALRTFPLVPPDKRSKIGRSKKKILQWRFLPHRL